MTALNLTQPLVDEEGENQAVRAFLMLYSATGGCDVGRMRQHMKRSGWEGCWPEWAANERAEYPLTKSGAQLWIRHLFSLERAALAQSPAEPELGDAEVDVLIDAVLTASGSAMRHFTVQRTIDRMRAAMRQAVASAVKSAAPVSAEGLTDARIIELARRHLDRCLYYGPEKVTRAIDSELIAFVRAAAADKGTTS